jgi:hypothetical protein
MSSAKMPEKVNISSRHQKFFDLRRTVSAPRINKNIRLLFADGSIANQIPRLSF